MTLKTLILAAMLPLAALAQNGPPTVDPKSADLRGQVVTEATTNVSSAAQQTPKVQITDKAELPGTGFHMVSTNTGQQAMISDDGRYTITGQFRLRDNLNNQFLASPAQAHYLANRVDLKTLPLDKMYVLNAGRGNEDIYVFVDPKCPVCKAMLGYLNQHRDRYKIHILPVGVLSEESIEIAQRIECVSEKDPAKAADLVLTNTADTLHGKAECDVEGYKHNMLLGHLLGLEAVPFVIASDGTFTTGMPADIQEALTKSAGGAP